MPGGGSCCAALRLLLSGASGATLRGTLPKAVVALSGPRGTALPLTCSLLGAAACLGCSGFWALAGAGLGCAFAGACLLSALPFAVPAVHCILGTGL